MCNTNHCPVGVATQDQKLISGVAVSNKSVRVANYHRATVFSVSEIIEAMGFSRPGDLKPWHISPRASPTAIQYYGEMYEFLNDGDLLQEPLPATFERANKAASAETFAHVSAEAAMSNTM